MDIASAIVFYKIITILTGLCFGYMGYRLFLSGVVSASSDMVVEWKKNKLMLTKTAPGIFFALFGGCIIGLTVFKGIDYNELTTSDLSQRRIANSPLPEESGHSFYSKHNEDKISIKNDSSTMKKVEVNALTDTSDSSK